MSQYPFFVDIFRNRCGEVPELEYDDGLRFYYFYTETIDTRDIATLKKWHKLAVKVRRIAEFEEKADL